MTWYVEWVEKPEYRCGGMIPIAQAADMVSLGLSGFTTVYQFEEPAARLIRDSKKSKGFKRFVVSTERLIIDCDDGEAGLKILQDRLAELGIGYDLYFSGKKGYHLYLYLKKRMTGIHVPHSQLEWIKQQGLLDYVDKSLFRASSIVSAPGRIHPDTGVKKRFLKTVTGYAIEVPYVEPETLVEFDFSGENEEDTYSIGMLQLAALIEQPDKGNRHIKLWSTSELLCKSGMPFELCRDLMLFMNSKWPEEKTPEEVIRACEQGFSHYG